MGGFPLKGQASYCGCRHLPAPLGYNISGRPGGQRAPLPPATTGLPTQERTVGLAPKNRRRAGVDLKSLSHHANLALLGVGCAVLDIVREVERYPGEDEEVRALTQDWRLGGNVANTLSLLRQLGHACAWCGTLADDAASEEILAALVELGIDTSAARRWTGYQSPLSCVTLSRATGSRSIVHFRDLPELEAQDFTSQTLSGYGWLHFEGRNPMETSAMLRDAAARRPDLPISLEIEKPRPGLDSLLVGPWILIFSRAYVLASGHREPEAFLATQWPKTSAELLFLAWGEVGAYGQARQGPLYYAPAHAISPLVDTLAAGDVFNAALIDGLRKGLALEFVLSRAVNLAGHKCGRRGLEGVVASAQGAGWR